MTRPYTPRKNSTAYRVWTAINNASPGAPWTVPMLADALSWPTDHARGTMPLRVALDTLKRHGLMCYRPATWALVQEPDTTAPGPRG